VTVYEAGPIAEPIAEPRMMLARPYVIYSFAEELL